MQEFGEQLVKYLDYLCRYQAFKAARVLVISTAVMVFILLVRKALAQVKGAAALYLRAYLWMLLLPVPFLGCLRISVDHVTFRGRLYMRLYEFTMSDHLPGLLYLGGAAIFALCLLFRRHRLKKCVKQMTDWDGAVFPEDMKSRTKRVRVKVTPLAVTPFTIGIWRHIFVIPECILNGCTEEELHSVLRHEYSHIRRGHLILYAVADVFRVLWFFNPLAHFCVRCFKEDLEMICDDMTMRAGEYLPEHYGGLLVKSLQLISTDRKAGRSGRFTPAFAAGRSFRIMKRRIRGIAGYRKNSKRHYAFICIAACLTVLAVSIGAAANSYPIYTPFGTASVYNRDANKIILDDYRIPDGVIVEGDDGLLVDNREMRRLLAEAGSTDELVWIYYGGYSKMPGIGGGGNVVEYQPYKETGDTAVITVDKGPLYSRMLDWLIKYM